MAPKKMSVADKASDAFKYMDQVCPGWEHGEAARHIAEGLRDGVAGGQGEHNVEANPQRQGTPGKPSPETWEWTDKQKTAKQSVNTAVQDKASQRARVEKREFSKADDEASKRGFFHLFQTKADANGDGVLNLEELACLMEDLGMDGNESRKLMKAADRNGDGVIEPNEFFSWMFESNSENAYRARDQSAAFASRACPFAIERPSTTPAPSKPKPKVAPDPNRPITAQDRVAAQNVVRDLFSNWADMNHDGFLDLQELGLLMEKLGMDSAGAERLMKVADKNGDQLVTVTEFVDWLFSGTKGATKALRVAADRASPTEAPA